jgi:hypothetical protein
LASGCTLAGPLAEAETLVVTRCRESIRRQRAALRAEVDDQDEPSR